MTCAKCHGEHEDGTACPGCSEDTPPPPFPLDSELDLRTIVLRPSEPADSTPRAESEVATVVEGGLRTPAQSGPSNSSGVKDWSSSVEQDGDAAPLGPGWRLGGRYEILEVLGEGGMGSVYKARDLEVNRLVAIKTIRTELAHDPTILQRFKQELILARDVTHRNVVRIYDLGVAGGVRFISMEYIEGRELSELLLERGKFDPKEAAEIMLQVCQGLGAAHERGVIHRDLKPQNIMLDGEGRAAVMDFGIARSGLVTAVEEEVPSLPLPGQEGLTMAGSLLGTPRYMSPEQAHGRTVDIRSDLYSVGIVFYELLTGKLPFNAPSVKQLLNNRGLERVPSVTEVDARIPKRLAEIVLKCMAATPDDRYQTTGALIADLELWLGIRRKNSPLNRWGVLASAIALLAIVASGLLVRDRLAREDSTAHRPVTVLISDFRNSTGQAVFNGVVEPMLQVAMEGAPFISSFNRGQAHKIAATLRPGVRDLDEHLSRLVALREGIGVILGGAVERHGSGFRLLATAMDPTGKQLLQDHVDFDQSNQLPKAVDQVAESMRRVLGDRSHLPAGSGAETFTSGSLESAQKYAAAQQLQWEGKWAEAIEMYRQATLLDPKMSRAYAGMAAMLANLGKRQEAEKYYRLALANIDRESEREKYRTRGGYYLLMRDYQKAAEQFGQLVKQYPVDSAGLANLALAYFYGRNMTAALEEGRKAVAIYPQNILQRNNLGLYAMYAGDFDGAIKESQSIIKLNPSFEKAYLCLGIAQAQEGSIAEALQTYGELAKLSDWGASEAALAEGDLALYQGRYQDAVKTLQAGIDADLKQKNTGGAGTKYAVLADAQLQARQRGEALKSAAKALTLNNDPSVLYMAAQVELEAGDKGAAAAQARRLDEQFEPDPRALAALIKGEIQLGTGNLHEALAAFQESQKIADTWLGRNDLGRVYLAAKIYPDAENEFDLCLKRRGEASAVFLDDEPTLRYIPSVYYRRGLARVGLHNAASADDLKEFLAIRKASDPSAMVSDARQKLRAE